MPHRAVFFVETATMSDTTFFDDGHVGLSIERPGATMRLFDKPAHEDKPPYIRKGAAS